MVETIILLGFHLRLSFQVKKQRSNLSTSTYQCLAGRKRDKQYNHQRQQAMNEHSIKKEELSMEGESPIASACGPEGHKSINAVVDYGSKSVRFKITSKTKNKEVIITEYNLEKAIDAYNFAFERM